jgi:hypothetical protein
MVSLSDVGVYVSVVAAVVPTLGGLSESTAFVGSMAVSSAFGVVFAGQNAKRVLDGKGPRFAPAAMTAGIGGWFVYAPLAYEVSGLATAAAQSGGMAMLVFGVYVGLCVLEESFLEG